MKKNFLIILALILLVSCDSGIRHTLPREYKITKEKKYDNFPRELRIYKINGNINEEKLKDYPDRAPVYCSIEKWIDFNLLNTNDRKYINAVVKETIERIGLYDKNGYKELDSIFNDNRHFYFSGFFSNQTPHISHKFYDVFNFLDIQTNKLYSFKYLKGY